MADQVLDNGTIALFLSPLAVILTAAITSFFTRRSNKEASDISRFEAIMSGYETSRDLDAKRIAGLETKVNALNDEVSTLKSQYAAQGRQLTQIKVAVQNWFSKLWTEWPHGDGAMPLPTVEELGMMELTVPEQLQPVKHRAAKGDAAP